VYPCVHNHSTHQTTRQQIFSSFIAARRLTISGKREKHEERKDKKSIYSESCSGQVFRVVDLPADVNTENAKADLKDGILQLEIPKATPAKKVSIAPKAA